MNFLPGLFVAGLGVGVMLTPSVTVVQSAFPDSQQGEISGLSRSVSNLGSSLGTAIAGTILVIAVDQGNRAYAMALVALGDRRGPRVRHRAVHPAQRGRSLPTRRRPEDGRQVAGPGLCT